MSKFGYLGTPLRTLNSLLVEQLRLGRGATLLIDALHDKLPVLFPGANMELIAHLDLLGRFGGGTIQLDFAPVDRIGRQAAGLEEACCPKPFIEAHSTIP
jgi:hypothetical protein